MGAEKRAGHIADREREGWALCGVALAEKRIAAEPAGTGEFCGECERLWESRRGKA